jgi:hypothetical protein
MIFLVVSVLLGYDAMPWGDWFQTFRHFNHLISKGRNVREESLVVFVLVYRNLGNDHLIRPTFQFIVIHSYVAEKPLVTDGTVKS